MQINLYHAPNILTASNLFTEGEGVGDGSRMELPRVDQELN